MGTVLEVSIAVCLEKVLTDKILHFEIRDGDDDDETITKLALIASALRDCARKLQLEYRHLEGVPATSEALGNETWHLPHSFMPALKFKSKLSRENEEVVLEGDKSEMGALFLADYTPKGSETAVETVVKFAVTYNKDAHKQLAGQKYAPELYVCESVVGGREMVVMERVKGRRMCDHPLNSLPRSVFEDIARALDILHCGKLVFGDLRDTNVMILEDASEGRIGAKLIDFDWVGERGKAFYPALVNADIVGTEYDISVRARGLMHGKHDSSAFNFIYQNYYVEGKKGEEAPAISTFLIL